MRFRKIFKYYRLFCLLAGCFAGRTLCAQVINYSHPTGDNIRSTTFQIIGKCGPSVLIYKNEYSTRKISFYNAAMQLTGERELDFLPKNILQVDFVAYAEKIIMFYQYHHKGAVICEAVILDSLGSPIEKPVFIDQTDDDMPVLEKDKWYGLLVSGNRGRMMVYQVRLVMDSLRYHLATFLVDSSLRLLHKSLLTIPVKNRNDEPSHFTLTDEGDLLFAVTGREYETDPYYNKLILVHKPPLSDKISGDSCRLNGHSAGRRLLLQPDEYHNQVWLLAFLYDGRRRDINALCSVQYDYHADTVRNQHVSALTDSLKQKMKGKNHALRDAFDNSLLKDLIVDKSGRALLIAEDVFTDGNGVAHYGNIALMELDRSGALVDAEMIGKDQASDLQEDFASYLLVNTGDALHLLFNKAHRVSRFLTGYLYLIIDYRYGAGRQLKEMPLFRRLDRKYRWSPRNGMQIGSREVVIPCVQGGGLLFAKITYPP